MVIALVRPHIEKSRSPRGLWVPFPLGRPLGEPEDPSFQRRVLLSALRLLERAEGPVILEDFADDAPSMRDNADWAPDPVLMRLPMSAPSDAAGWASALRAEMNEIQPHWQAATHRFGRTTVGVSKLEPSRWPDYLAAWLSGTLPASPVAGLSAAVAMRFIADDLKAMYSEAVQAHGPQPAAGQVQSWFWRSTMAGALLRAIRGQSLTSADSGFNTAGSRFVVPGPFVNPA
ncbi:MAG TPA: hypothetical protein PK264_16015 [Hyphomicrobiaceae bacterium]|nr:hypothetical protein [Hyphomicrobiaceae bacterium]